MKDLTRGSITLHIITMAAPVAITMLAGIAYHLINLYFVSRLGTEATAGLNAAGTATFIVTALNQVLGTGTAVLISHSLGRKDSADTTLVFNQSLAFSVACAAITVITLYLLMPPYMTTVSRESGTIAAGISYVNWASPAYALLFPMITLSSTLRAAGAVQASVVTFALTLLLNALLAPVFIAGWGTGIALGVAGAGLATSVSVVIGLGCLWVYFFRSQKHICLQRALLSPQLRQWQRIVEIGWPAGAEYVLMFLTGGVVYFLIRDFGASAQAGFGIGSRIVQTIFLPAMAVASAAGPIAGQSFGAKDGDRVYAVFRTAALIGALVMLAATLLVQLWPTTLVDFFEADAATAAAATLFLQIMSWTFVAAGLVFTCAFLFQGVGNTVPSLISATARFVVFAAPAAWFAQRADFRIEQLWYLSTASVAIQAVLSLWLLRLEFQRKLRPFRLGVAELSGISDRARSSS